jgi:hypothetical protein
MQFPQIDDPEFAAKVFAAQSMQSLIAAFAVLGLYFPEGQFAQPPAPAVGLYVPELQAVQTRLEPLPD